MSFQPAFTSPIEAIEFIDTCLQQNDADKLYAAFTEPPSDFWKEHLVQDLGAIQQAETLERVFLEDGKIIAFPEQEDVLHLGGHSPRTHFLHIGLVKTPNGWVLQSIHMCR